MKIDHLKKHAYSPYSSHKEDWCVVQGRSGMLYPGVRIENISFPLTITPLHGAVCSCLGNKDEPISYFSDEMSEELTSYWTGEYNLEKLSSVPEGFPFYSPFIMDVPNPKELLEVLTENSVTVHSGFPVSSLLYTDKGVVPGVNVEVESWALGLCAERLSLFRAVSAGALLFEKLAVYAPKGDFSSPCGACRQVLMEWMPDKIVELHHGDNTLSSHKVIHLLPYAFSSSKLAT